MVHNPFEHREQLPASIQLFRLIDGSHTALPETLLSNQELTENLAVMDTNWRRFVDPIKAAVDAKEELLQNPEYVWQNLYLAGPIELDKPFRGIQRAMPSVIYKWRDDASFYEFTISKIDGSNDALSVMVASEMPPFVALNEDDVTNACNNQKDVPGRVRAYLADLREKGQIPDYINEDECATLLDFTIKSLDKFLEHVSAGPEVYKHDRNI